MAAMIRTSMLDRIEDQIVERASNLRPVDADGRRQGFRPFDRDGPPPRLLAEQRRMLGEEPTDIGDRLGQQFGALHRAEKILQQLVHPPHLFDHDPQCVR